MGLKVLVTLNFSCNCSDLRHVFHISLMVRLFTSVVKSFKEEVLSLMGLTVWLHTVYIHHFHYVTIIIIMNIVLANSKVKG